MPYVTESERRQFECAIKELQIGMSAGITVGQLNYLFTRIALIYTELRGLNYTCLNDVVGALESAKAEFQRRLVAPYEEKKANKNGDVY